MCSSFKVELFTGIHDVSSDILKMALFTDSADLGPSTTVYSSENEVSGTGYTLGGEVLTNVAVSLSGASAIVDFDNLVWNSASFTTRGALIYNSSKGNRAVAVYDFGENKALSGGNFEISPPSPTAAYSVLWIS